MVCRKILSPVAICNDQKFNPGTWTFATVYRPLKSYLTFMTDVHRDQNFIILSAAIFLNCTIMQKKRKRKNSLPSIKPIYNSDGLFQTANGAQSPLREELYNTRITHRVSLRNLKFHDLCRSSGAVVLKDTKRPFLYSCGAVAWMAIGVVSHLYLFSPMSPSCYNHSTSFLSHPESQPSSPIPIHAAAPQLYRKGRFVSFTTTAPDDRHKSWIFKLRKETLCVILVLQSLYIN